MPDATSHLRNRPRQARSAARVELLLDVAAEVFEEVGYDAATTNLVAARADVPVGTLYRWFPDKAALAEALTDRYLAHLVGLYDELLGDSLPEERIGDFLRRVLRRLLEETRDQRALPALLVSAMVPGGRADAGARLRRGLEDHVREPDRAARAGPARRHRGPHLRGAGHPAPTWCWPPPPTTTTAAPRRDDRRVRRRDARLPRGQVPARRTTRPGPTPTCRSGPIFPAPDRATRLAAQPTTEPVGPGSGRGGPGHGARVLRV